MIQMQTMLDVADNSGARTARCIKVLGNTKRRYAALGDVVILAVQKSTPAGAVKKGQVVRGVIVRTRYPARRIDGSYVRFDTNAVVIVDKDGNPRGTRIFGAVARELREKKYARVVSLAEEIV